MYPLFKVLDVIFILFAIFAALKQIFQFLCLFFIRCCINILALFFFHSVKFPLVVVDFPVELSFKLHLSVGDDLYLIFYFLHLFVLLLHLR